MTFERTIAGLLYHARRYEWSLRKGVLGLLLKPIIFSLPCVRPLAAAASQNGPAAYKQSGIKDEMGVRSSLSPSPVAAASSPPVPTAARGDAGAAARWSLHPGMTWHCRKHAGGPEPVLNGSFGATPSFELGHVVPVSSTGACPPGACEYWPCAGLARSPRSPQPALGCEVPPEHEGFCGTVGTWSR